MQKLPTIELSDFYIEFIGYALSVLVMLWIKDTIDDKINIINANKVRGKFLTNVLIVQFNDKFELIRTIESEKIDITSFNWKIKNSNISENKY